MPPNLATEIAALPRLRVSELRAKFAVAFGEPTPSHNKVWLVKRIAWRLQALAEGDLSERARQRAAELVSGADLRLSAPPAQAPIATSDQPPKILVPKNDRLPRPGTILTRRYKGRTLQVEILEHGFAFEGQVWRAEDPMAPEVAVLDIREAHVAELADYRLACSRSMTTCPFLCPASTYR